MTEEASNTLSLLGDQANNTVDYSQLLGDLADKFFPIFVTIFSFLLLGYIMGRCNVLPTGRGKSVLAAYIFNIALPAGILYNMVNVHLTNIDTGKSKSLCNFITGIALVKTFLYVSVVVVGLLLRSRTTNWAVVFLFGLASVHSNDYGIGQPLLHALFDNSTYKMTRVYPSLMEDSMVLTYATYAPITIFFLELRRNRELSLKWGKSLLYALLRSMLRPAVLAALLGVVLQFIVGASAPNTVITQRFMKWFGDGVLSKLTQTITPIYLIYTGLALVGSVKHFTSPKQIMAIIVITVIKLGFSPLLMKLTQLFMKDNTDSLSVLFYLYGTLPTSPIVVIFASQYGLITPTFAMIVLCSTICFAPVSTLFLSLYYVSWCQLFNEQTTNLVNNITEGLGYFSVAIAIWLLIVMVFLCRYRKAIYHMLIGQIVCLIVYSTLTACVKINEVSVHKAKATSYGKAVTECVFCLLGCGYLFILGVSKRTNNAAYMSRVILYYVLACTGVPALLLALTNFPYSARLIKPHNYIWDYTNNISTEFVIAKVFLLSSSVVLGLLPFFVRYIRVHQARREYEPLEETSELSTGMRNFHNNKMGRDSHSGAESCPCDITLRESNKFQIAGFMSMIMGMMSILVNIWGVFQVENASKLFLGVVLIHQNLWLFNAILMALIFGTPITEIREKMLGMKDKLVLLILKDEFNLPQLESLRPETVKTCTTFREWHMTACLDAIAHSVDGTFGLVYEDVFTGSDFVSWLLNVGLAEDRHDAMEYGSKLVIGRVMEHIDKKKTFYDREYLYRFVKAPSTITNVDASDELRGEHFQVEHERDTRSMPDWF